MSTLLKFSENAVPNSPGNNDGVENIGDAYTNMAVLIVIKEYLELIQDEKQYTADEAYGRAIVSSTLLFVFEQQKLTTFPPCYTVLAFPPH